MASSVRTGLPGMMSAIDFTLNGDEPLAAKGTAESSVPDFFIARWYSQCGTCRDSPVVMRLPPCASADWGPEFRSGFRRGPRPRRTNPGPSPVLPTSTEQRPWQHSSTEDDGRNRAERLPVKEGSSRLPAAWYHTRRKPERTWSSPGIDRRAAQGAWLREPAAQRQWSTRSMTVMAGPKGGCHGRLATRR